MKYIIVNKKNRRLLRNSILDEAPNNLRAQAEVVELTQAEADAVDEVVKNLLPGERVTINGKVAEVVSMINVIEGRPFTQQLKSVLGTRPSGVRNLMVNKIGPAFALDDLPVMLSEVNSVDTSDLPEAIAAKAESLKTDLVTVIGREIARRELL
jgi:hypothetical protein